MLDTEKFIIYNNTENVLKSFEYQIRNGNTKNNLLNAIKANLFKFVELVDITVDIQQDNTWELVIKDRETGEIIIMTII